MFTKSLFGLALVILILPTVAAAEANCTSLKEQLHKERNLLKKRHMLTQAIASCPADTELHYMYAYSAERLRKYDNALKSYLETIAIDSGFSKAYFGLGDIYMVLGNAEAAIRAYEQGLALEPADTRARASLELARIKHKAASGDRISSGEFIRVMQESKSRSTTEGAIDGPLLRLQIQFAVSSADLTPQAKEQLKIVGQALENQALAGQAFEIAGHTDNSGSPAVNLQLSKERAEQVKSYLLTNFAIAADKLTVAYYGDTRPAVPNTSSENRALNRRVEFRKVVP